MTKRHARSAAADQGAEDKPRSQARMQVKRVIDEASPLPPPAPAGDGLGLLDQLAELETTAPDPSGEMGVGDNGRRVARPTTERRRHATGRPNRDPLIGKEFRGLRIERKLGEGGMGSVYEALQLSLERPVALKVLSPELRGNDSFISRLEGEAKILARINHPNILHVYDFGEEHALGIYFMVMEFVDGSDLTELLQRRRRLGQIEALEIVRQAALGLDAAAQRGIIHRDIKPDNLMITREGVCKVSDFGLATDIGAGEGDHAGGNRVGTPAFMSPEQCQGNMVDVRSDVYSLGCTAFVALTGHLPFQADSPFEIMLQHRTVPPPPLRGEVHGIAPEAERLVHRMMAKRSHERFASMGELAEEIKQLLDHLLAIQQQLGSGRETQELTPDLPNWLME